ncbi:hypothetical protein MPH_09829 [Macrophomina phaseolina MS6]|uniref:Proteolipid membrane potential modulator n=2 Tax=Macrophomina phaseolina TaxID=35725 RepID=K2RS18_MACPH|nr:hypothetical protein MPH_09829 [Macrophomina phaseolina MS6]KAH7030155.1 hypothetical protein B0J12DRAFT_320211 [Macrophomina phaseolina]
MCGSDIFLALLALLFPPVAVWVKRGICSADSLINIALCCLGLLPGLLHAWYIIWAYPDPGDEYERVAGNDSESNVTYYYVAHTTAPAGPPQHQQPYRTHAAPNYGAAGTRPVPKSTSSQQFPGQQQAGVVNPWADEVSPAAQQGSSSAQGAGEGSTSQPPPTYAEAVRGDHKVQTHD